VSVLAHDRGRIPGVRTKPEPSASQLLATVRDARRVAIRSGSMLHRFTSLWAVVVGDRVFVRSWSVKPRSWYRTLLVEPRGVLQLKEREVPFRSVRTRSEAVKAAVDRAYVLKYDHPGDIPYVKDMTGPKSRATTTELVLGQVRAASRRSRTGRAPRAPAASRPRSRA
jgi:hypothetical protein